MNDFLKQLRSGGSKRFDRGRRPYDSPQYRGADRQNGKDRKNVQHRKNYDHGQLLSIKKTLETIAETQKALVGFAERQAAASERIADALESLGPRRAAKRPQETPAIAETAEDLTPPPVASTSDDTADTPPIEPAAAETDPESRNVVKIIRDLRNDGSTFEEIAQYLRTEQIPTRSGKGQWRPQSVSRLLNQQVRENEAWGGRKRPV